MSTDIFIAATSLFQNISLAQSFVFFLYVVVGGGVYYALKTYFPQLIENKKLRAEHDRKQIELMENALNNLTTMLQGNTTAMTGFNQAILTLNQTFEKVSDKLFSHDEKSKNIYDQIIEVKDGIESLKNNSPTSDSILRIHNRIDGIDQNGADKNDVNIIISKLDQIQEAVSEIKGKLR